MISKTLTIAGNHDIMLDSAHQSDSIAQDISRCQDLFKNSTSITYLNHEATAINLNRGPHTTFKIFGSPYSPEIDTKWAFGYKSDEEASLLWDKIPTETDIVLTHTPPKNHLDQRKDGIPVGCAELQNALQRIRPHLHICGHVHESRGGEQIQWDPESQKEFSTDKWNDPGIGNKKLSFLDLTSKSSQSLNWLDQNGEVPTTGALVNLMAQERLKLTPYRAQERDLHYQCRDNGFKLAASWWEEV